MLTILNIQTPFYFIFFHAISLILFVIPLLGSVAFFTLSERKFMASVQRRKGPNVVGFWGLLQPLADGLKLVLKEAIVPTRANFFVFVLAPMLTFILSLLGWAAIPFTLKSVIVDIPLSVLFVFAVSSLGVYGIIISGWASNSKYAFLGALRSAAQMISYEISLGFIIVGVILCSGSLNLIDIVHQQKLIWFIVPLWPLALMFFISMLAETNRAPFDLPEAEAEIVAGYNVEYSAILFALFFLGEYSNMLLMSVLFVLLFCGGWLVPSLLVGIISPEIFFVFKIGILTVAFVLVRAILPRTRYDQLMSIGWKKFLPLTLGYFLWLCGWLYVTDGFVLSELSGYCQLAPSLRLL